MTETKKKRLEAAKKCMSILDVFKENICKCMTKYSLDEITAEITPYGVDVDYCEYADSGIIGSNIDIPELSELLQQFMPKLNIKELSCTRSGDIFDFEIHSAAQMPFNIFADVPTAAENKNTLHKLPTSHKVFNINL